MGRPTGASRSTWALTVSPSTTPKVLESPGAQPWPSSPPEFRDIFTAWTETVSNVGRRLPTAVGRRARGAARHLRRGVRRAGDVDRWCAIRGHRRPIPGRGAHKDSGVLTLLLAEPGSDGLRVEAQRGEWIDAPPIPYTFIVNIGELLEVATGGAARDATPCAEPAARQDQVSVPFFYNPDWTPRSRCSTSPPAVGVELDPGKPDLRHLWGECRKSRSVRIPMWRSSTTGSCPPASRRRTESQRGPEGHRGTNGPIGSPAGRSTRPELGCPT